MPQHFPQPHEGQAPKEFGIDANILKVRRFNLTNARMLEQIEIGGSCLWAIAATSLTANIDLRINTQQSDPLTFQQGMFIRGIPFSRLFVSHAAQAGETITLFFAVEEDTRNIQIVNPSLAFNQINVTKSTYYFPVADVTLIAGAATLIMAATVLRRDIYITNLVGNLETIRIANNPLANSGTPVAPGETIIVSTTGLIQGWNPGVADQDVAISYTTD